jgi:hypothetical protein
MHILLHSELVSTWNRRHQTADHLQVAWLLDEEVEEQVVEPLADLLPTLL